MDVQDSNIKFASNYDEVKYWQTKAEKTQTELQALREEFQEHCTINKQFEEEMDTLVKHLTNKKKNLEEKNNSLQEEVESLKKKLESLRNAHEVSRLQTDLCEVTARNKKQQKCIVQLEQQNDDLEMQNRIAAFSLTDLEKNLNMALERIVFLENELKGKEIPRESIQRLKDEARDSRNELKVEGMRYGTANPEHSSTPDLPSSSGVECASVTSTSSSSENSWTPSAISDNSAENSPTTSTATTNKGSVISSAAQISTLSIVEHLLQKVCTLKTILASSRNFSAGSEQPCSGLVASGSPVKSPRVADSTKEQLSKADEKLL